jgi:hypothetical protein
MSKVIDNIEDIASIDNHIGLSGITSYHLLQGNMSLSNTISTNGFSTTLYTGNGSTQSINTGVDMDTQWGNDASEKFGGLVWAKYRSGTTTAVGHSLNDTIRGTTKAIYTHATSAETTEVAGLLSFNNNGFNIGASYSTNTVPYASWNFQTTHRVSGTTNHGKAYTCHFNPFTGFTIIKYEGSGIAGHEIPHHLGRKLGFWTIKNLTTTFSWLSAIGNTDGFLHLNTADAKDANTGGKLETELGVILNNSWTDYNTSGNQYILYGWANSYIDESNKLIGNYEVGVYQGTGASGNKVVTRGKPAWIMIKRIDSTSNWAIYDNKRNIHTSFDNVPNILYPHSNIAEDTASTSHEVVIVYDGFLVDSGVDINASGGQYLYMVVYDNDSASGKSTYPRATDTTQIQLNNAIVPLANGVDGNGVKVSTVSKNETVTGVTLTQGKNYLRWEN